MTTHDARTTHSPDDRSGSYLYKRGLGITALNLIHLNAYLLLLGPALVLAGVLAVWPRRCTENALKQGGQGLSPNASLALQIAFWLLLAWAALIGPRPVWRSG